MVPSEIALRIGLTGGIGSGKSTVSTFLAGHGAALIDTDLIARQLTQPGGAALGPIAREFGAYIIEPSGALDRVHMRELVFADPAAKQRLEAILHPLIGIECERQTQAVEAPMLVFDVPLLVESQHWRSRVDKILVVDCHESTQIDRVVRRSGWSASTVRAVIDQQASRIERQACADAVIFNDSITLQLLAEHTHSVWRRWAEKRH